MNAEQHAEAEHYVMLADKQATNGNYQLAIGHLVIALDAILLDHKPAPAAAPAPEADDRAAPTIEDRAEILAAVRWMAEETQHLEGGPGLTAYGIVLQAALPKEWEHLR